MAEKDVTEKALESYNDVFADIVNVLLFDGENLVKEDELEQGRERGDYTGEKGVREHERDSSKFWRRNQIRIAYLGLENETEAEDDMPFRVIGYDGAAYRDQLGYHMGEDGKRQKNTERYPVVTLVLYLGYQHKWDKATSLHDALGDKIPQKLKPYVQNYGLNIFNIAFLPDETVKKFKSDFRIVADYLVKMRKNGSYVPLDQTIIHVREVLNFMSAVTRDDRFRETADRIEKGEKPKNMCTWLDEVENRCIREGREEGIREGRREGIREGREEGTKEGLKKGYDALARAISDLLQSGRGEDILKVVGDADFKEKLLSELEKAAIS